MNVSEISVKPSARAETKTGLKFQSRIPLSEKQSRCHHAGLRAACSLKNEERNLVEILIEAEELQLPKAFELPSPFRYAVEILGLSEPTTGMLINVARKSKAIPKLRAAIYSRQLTVSKAHKFCAAVSETNAGDWIQFATTHSAREIEDRVRGQDPSRKKSVKLMLSLNTEKLLKRVQSLESQRQGRPVSKEESFEIALEFFVDRKDPVRRADRATQRSTKMKNHNSRELFQSFDSNNSRESYQLSEPNNSRESCQNTELQRQTGATRVSRPSGSFARAKDRPLRVPLSAEQRNLVLARTRGCCTYVNSRGERCNEDRWVDVHHLVSVQDGGNNDAKNLTVLCGFHHDLVHQLELPLVCERPPETRRTDQKLDGPIRISQ